MDGYLEEGLICGISGKESLCQHTVGLRKEEGVYCLVTGWWTLAYFAS